MVSSWRSAETARLIAALLAWAITVYLTLRRTGRVDSLHKGLLEKERRLEKAEEECVVVIVVVVVVVIVIVYIDLCSANSLARLSGLDLSRLSMAQLQTLYDEQRELVRRTGSAIAQRGGV